ncbi:MAG: hemolysin family protein [Thermodesulfovibrionales bacterium]
MALEIFLIFLFLVLNGFFSAAEIAVVTSRKALIKNLADQGNLHAVQLRKLQSEPDRFLATVQIGVTVMGALASAIGGAASVRTIEPLFAAVPIPYAARFASTVAIAVVVLVISYLSIILGELLPKAIALRNPEKIGMLVAGPISTFSKIASLFVNVLTASTNVFLRPFGAKTFSQRSFISEEEIKLLIEEGKDRGIFEPTEHELIHSVFKFTDISVKGVVVPFTQIVAFGMNESAEAIIRTIAEENFSRYPVYDRDKSDIKGLIYAKDVFNELAFGREISVPKLLHPALFAPETMKISMLMREMQKKRLHMAIVVDEYGVVTGLVTIEDLLEEIVGEIRDEYDTEVPVQHLRDGSLLIDASLAVRDLNEDHGFSIPESNEYDTIGGFLISYLQRMPSVGDSYQTERYNFTIVSVKGRRILKIKATPLGAGDGPHTADL